MIKKIDLQIKTVSVFIQTRIKCEISCFSYTFKHCLFSLVGGNFEINFRYRIATHHRNVQMKSVAQLFFY